MSAPTLVECPFRGADEGTAAMTWGQLAIRRSMRWLEDESYYFNLGHVFDVPDGRSQDDVLAAVGALVSRHEGLRTRYPGWATQDVSQQVHAAGTVPVEVTEAASDLDGACAEVLLRVRDRAFDHEAEWPVRFALLHVDGVPRRLVCVLSHQCMDGTAWRVIREELTALLDGCEPDEPVAAWSPRDLAAFEASSSGARRNAASLRRWRGALEMLPASLFDVARRTPHEPRFQGLVLESRAAAAAAQMIATECATSTSTVLLAAVLATLGEVTGHENVGIVLIVANRTRAEVRRTVAPLAQDGLLAMPLDRPTFQDLVGETWVGALDAFRAAQYEPAEMAREIAAVEGERGIWSDRSAFFNDVRSENLWSGVEPRAYGPAELAALQEHTSVRPEGEWARLDLKAFFAVRGAPDRLRLLMQLDTVYVDHDAARALLLGIDRLLVRAATEQVLMADVGAVSGLRTWDRPAHWVRLARGWYDPVALRDVVAAFPGVAGVVLEPVEGAAPRAVLRASGAIDLAGLDAHVRAALVGRTDLVAPSGYVLEGAAARS